MSTETLMELFEQHCKQHRPELSLVKTRDGETYHSYYTQHYMALWLDVMKGKK